ncbi:winged helix-turn-helix domain-containing protein [Serratia aquatilis]|uniref:Transcriptional regulator n=1 Tax=Serratia aquatilis TaxID=1737515 RepID=A0ABV6ECH1_9GAMM
MKYIINLSVVFDANARVLILKNDPHLYVELSKPATRLLCELIINNNVTMAREDIIKTVWVDYGFSPSKASLSNHISELRKSFESLGLTKEIIITEPKIGFRMEAEIHPVIKQTEISKDVVNDDDISLNDIVLSEPENRTAKPRGNTWLKAGVVILGLIAFSITAGYHFFTSNKKDAIRLVTTKGSCNIYGLSNTPPANFIANASNMIENEKIDCTHETADIYYTDERQASSLLTIRLMAVCYPSDDEHYQNCKNYKIVK